MSRIDILGHLHVIRRQLLFHHCQRPFLPGPPSTSCHCPVQHANFDKLCVQNGVIQGMWEFWQSRQTSVYVTDPYRLGLCYEARKAPCKPISTWYSLVATSAFCELDWVNSVSRKSKECAIGLTEASVLRLKSPMVEQKSITWHAGIPTCFGRA